MMENSKLSFLSVSLLIKPIIPEIIDIAGNPKNIIKNATDKKLSMKVVEDCSFGIMKNATQGKVPVVNERIDRARFGVITSLAYNSSALSLVNPATAFW